MRQFSHSGSIVRKETGAYIELVLLRGLDGAVLWQGSYNLDSFLEFPFGHGGSEAIVRCLMLIINRWPGEQLEERRAGREPVRNAPIG